MNERTQLLIAALIGETASALDHVRSGAGEVPAGTEERLRAHLILFTELWPGSSTDTDRVVKQARRYAAERVDLLGELLSDE